MYPYSKAGSLRSRLMPSRYMKRGSMRRKPVKSIRRKPKSKYVVVTSVKRVSGVRKPKSMMRRSVKRSVPRMLHKVGAIIPRQCA